MIRSIKDLLKAFAIVQKSYSHGLGFPYKSGVFCGAPVQSKSQPYITFDECELLEKKIIEIKNLYPFLWETIDLHYLHSRTIAGIAKKMAISTNTAHRYLSQAEAYLLAKLDEHIDYLSF